MLLKHLLFAPFNEETQTTLSPISTLIVTDTNRLLYIMTKPQGQ